MTLPISASGILSAARSSVASSLEAMGRDATARAERIAESARRDNEHSLLREVQDLLLTQESMEWMAKRTLNAAKRTAPRVTGGYRGQFRIERHDGKPKVVNRIEYRGPYATAVRVEGTGQTHFSKNVWPAALRAKRALRKRAIAWLVHDPVQAKRLKAVLIPRKRRGRRRRVR